MTDPNRLAERREAILAAAEKVFDANGYANTTIDAVAEAAAIAKGSVYNYFHSKRELFSQVFARAVADADAEAQQTLLGGPSAARKLERLLDHWSERLGHYNRIGRLVLEFWATAAREEQQGELASTFREMYARWRKQIEDILAEGIHSGEFDARLDPPVMASVIMAVLDGIEIQSILDMAIRVDPPFLAAIKESILTSLSAPGCPAGRESEGER